MANNREKFTFGVEAEGAQQTISKLQEIERLMGRIEKAHTSGVNNYFTTNQKDMDASMRAMSQISSTVREVSSELNDLHNKMKKAAEASVIPQGASKAEIREIERVKQATQQQAEAAIMYQKRLQQEYTRTLGMYQKLASFQQNPSKNFQSVFNSSDLYNLPRDKDSSGNLDGSRARKIIDAMLDNADDTTSKLSQVQSRIREVNNLDRRSESLSRRAAASGYMSYQQAQSFRSDFDTTRTDYTNERESNRESMARLGMERTRLTQEIKSIETNPLSTREDQDRKIAMQQTVRAIDSEMSKREELNKALDRTIQNMEKYNRSLLDANAEVKPERGTMRGMIYERAPSIGLALGGVFGATLGGLYARGASVNRSMRDDTIAIGQRTDQEDWRTNVRDDAFDAGLADRLGFTGKEMLQFQNNYLSNRGFEDLSDLDNAMSSQAEFSRVTGTSGERTSEFFDNVFRNSNTNSSIVNDIQNAFVGAIRQSGMAGREEEQLAALEGILDATARGRTMDSSEVMSTMAMQSLLASTGERSLQGREGGQLLSDLDQGIRSGMDNPMARLVFGMGSKYQGLSGLWEVSQQMEKGITDVDNVQVIGNMATTAGLDTEAQNAVALRFIREDLGVDASTEQVAGIMDLYRSGGLTQERLEEVLSEDSSTGEQLSQDRLDNYANSHEATANQSEAVTEKQATQVNDFGEFGEAIREANSRMGNWNTAAYVGTVALGALAAAAASAAASFGVGSLLRGGIAGRYGGRGGPKGGGPGPNGGGRGGGLRGIGGALMGGLGLGGGPLVFGGPGTDRQNQTSPQKGATNSASTPKGGGRFGGLSSMLTGAWASVQGMFDPNVRKGGLPNRGPTNTPPNTPQNGRGGPTSGIVAGGSSNPLGAGKGILDKAGNVLGKAFLPISLLSGGMAVMSAPEGERGKIAGETVGGIGGGILGGAALGAAAGSIIPGLGTAVGGLVGGIAGGIGGSSLGGWIGGLFDGEGNEAKAATTEEIAKEANDDTSNTQDYSVTSQLERETATRRDYVEAKRADNISEEKRLLDRMEGALREADRILRQARLQNGIMGNANGAGGGGGQSLGGAGIGSLRFVEEGQKWTNNDITRHDLNFTDRNLTAEDLDAWIDSMAPSNSIMRGMGDAFFKAAQESGLDPRYLVAHAAHETGWGTSRIAKEKGNMYGIGAFDASPYSSAYNYNNTEAGIIEGAKWIAENYYSRGQTDLYSMRYNNGKHEYATDPQWHSKIANIMKGAPSGSGSFKVESTINVNVQGGDLTDQVTNSSAMTRLGREINEKIYGSMNYYANETRRV